MKKAFLISFVMAYFTLSMCLFPTSGFTKETIKYIGSSTVGKFIHEATNVYTDAAFEINTKPESGGGENATAAGKADIGGVARDVKPAILSKGVHKFLIGKDAIGAWVNAGNPVKDLTMEELKGIFIGKITNWKEVGGKNLPITIYIVNPQSATRKVFSKIALSGEKYGGNVKTVRPDPMIIEKVAADESGIGQLSFALGNSHPKAGDTRKINIGGETASVDNPNYQLTRPLYLITKGEPTGKVKSFIEWSQSEAGQSIVKKFFVGK